MAHTLTEQKYTMKNYYCGEDQYAELRNFFVDKFGWTLDGTKVISNLDPSFGFNIKARSSSSTHLEIRDLSGNIIYNSNATKEIYYHVSKNEKTIYLRIMRPNPNNMSYCYLNSIIIAYNKDNKATLYFACYATGGVITAETSNLYYTLNHNNALKSLANAGTINTEMDNTLYRTPDYRNHDLCSELYTVITVQQFSDITNNYITVNNQMYRIIECTYMYNPAYKPTFAFPVSD